MKRLPTIERVKKLLRYDAEVGAFFWLKHGRGQYVRAGARAGSFQSNGYRVVRIEGSLLLEHRLALFYVNGAWPDEVDHIDGDPSNNRMSNLRVCNRTQNNANKGPQRNGSSGFKGVSLFKRTGRWKAEIGCNGKRYHLGYFDTPEQAHAAYVAAAQKHFGEFARAS